MLSPPVVLTVAGSDCSGGAGIQADLKTFTTLGAYGTSAVTCVVAEHPARVQSIHPVPAGRVVEQIELVFEAFPVRIVKTGMLYSTEIITTVSRYLEKGKKKTQLVADPVMVATSGAFLLKKSAIRVLCDRLLPLASLVTPNIDEVSALLGKKIRSLDDAAAAAQQCATRWGVPFLVKGGHLRLKQAVDVFSDGKKTLFFRAKTIPRIQTHGTGCTYSAAIAVHLAHGLSLEKSIRQSKKFITRALRRRHRIGKFKPLNQLP